MKRTTLILLPLLALGVISAQSTGGMMTGGMMTGGMMTGGMMSGGAAVNQPLVVTLSGDQQVPPVATEATGSATVSLEGDTMSVSGDFSNLSSPPFEVAGTPAHIHMAPAGENGDVIFPLNVSAAEDGSSGVFSLSTTLTPEQVDAFNAGEFYINVHTEANQAGEVRGQITPGM